MVLKPDAPIELTDGAIRESALDLIDRVSTMTVATSGQSGSWAAPVYYAYREGMFFFLSKPDSRHIEEALAAGFAAAAIHAYAESWQQIRGLQMSGTIRHVPISLEAINAIQTYLKKFPFTKDFFQDDEPVSLKAVISRFKVQLYAFHPERAVYQDNRIKFGFRREILLK